MTARFWKELINCFQRPNDFKNSSKGKDPNTNMGLNIVAPGVTRKEYTKQFTRFHSFFKYRFLLPIILISEKILGRFIVKEIPETLYNKNILIFDNAWEKSIADWSWNYVGKGTRDISWLKSQLNDFCQTRLRTVKRLIMTFYINDTAYREFFDDVLYNITIMMNQAYKGDVDHIIYTSECINDVKYFNVCGINDKPIIFEYGGKYLYVNKNAAHIVSEMPQYIDLIDENEFKEAKYR